MLLILIFSINANCQQLKRESINSSDIIIEGFVSKKEYRYSPTDTNEIETLNFINVTKLLKGSIENKKIILLTRGGKMKNTLQKSSHGFTFVENDQGIFFLDIIEIKDNEVIVGLNKGDYQFIEYLENNEYEAKLEKSFIFFKDRKNLINQINRDFDTKVNESLIGSELCLTLDNVVFDFNNKKLKFDVKIKGNISGYKLSEMELLFSYPTKNFGSFIVSKQKLNIFKEEIVKNEVYTLNKRDVDSNSVVIFVNSDCIDQNQSEYFSLEDYYKKLVTIEMDVISWDYGILNFNDFGLSGFAKYFTLDKGCIRFDNLCIDEGSINLSS